MAELPVYLLEYMASKEAQVRWIVHGTAAEYLVPEELLHDAARFCEITIKIDAPSSAKQRAAIANLCEALRDMPDILASYDRSNIEALVQQDADWHLIRERAAEVLKAFEAFPYE
ncbi:hypothetical protein [Rhizobium sp. Leaf453]|uniref:hypothetical protein n=1 Tax=Rhizobium sp. Leaf453 TaxID=1736380 RepID=UPI000715CD46|nr:hypothetical protein [Rhizobium sp. Leaf453]KQU08369.1 hypothetical protein ASG68_22525 [Rhizobium sp. Leaf453]